MKNFTKKNWLHNQNNKKAMPLRSFRYSFAAFYDHLFIAFVVNLLWFMFHFFMIIPIPNAAQLHLLENQGAAATPTTIITTSQISNNAVINKSPETVNANSHKDGLTIANVVRYFAILLILFFSPFSIAVYRLNRDMHLRQEVKFIKYLSYIKKYFIKSMALLFINIAITALLFFNIWFYQKMLPPQSFLYYLATMATIMIYLIFLLIAINSLPILVNENLSLKKLYKRSYKLTIFNIAPSLFILFVIGSFLFFSKLPIKLFSMLSVTPFIFFFPVWSGQFLYESYVTVLEKFGHKRPYEENRSLKDFIFPWRINK